MIVKGIIKTINFSDNSCTVRLPIFETAAAQGEVVLDAIMLIQPGLYNGYAVGDIVFVDFENNKLSQPIVVGKLYLGAAKEAAAGAPSAMAVSNLKVTTQATLPIDTKLTLEGTGTAVPVENGITTYKSLIDIIKALHKTETSVEQTIKDQSGTIANIKVEYLSQPVDAATPEEGDPNWDISAPAYQDGYSIWQKTTCYNHRGQVLNVEILCLSGIASAVIYKLRCSTRVHAGTNQTENVKISAWVKLGTELETPDTTANICYCWSDSKGNLTSDWTETNSYEVVLTAAQLQAQNLIIQVKHGDEIYEEETIMYAPLNTPVLTLSNDTDVLLYAANGTDCVTKDGVKSTATLYVNGDLLEAEYDWTWDGNHCTCDFERDDQGNIVPSKRTIIVTAVNSTDTPGVVTCTATVTLEGPFKGKSYSKEFTVTQTKVGTSIISQETYYALIHNKHSAGDIKTPPKTGDLIVRDKAGTQLNTINESHLEEWSLTPPEHTPATNGWKYWSTIKTTYSTSLDDFEFSDPIINEDLSGVYSLAQGKTTNYYGTFEPTRNPSPTAAQVYKPNLRVDDCWFDTRYKEISATELATLDLASKYINYYMGEGSTKTLVTSSNYTTLSIQPKTTKAYTKGALKQCTAIAANGNATWTDIGDEMVTNKLTATYINALDITAKKIKILNDAGNTTLFEADGLSGTHKVQIGGYNVVGSTLTTGTTANKNQIILDGTNNLASTSARLTIGDNFKVLADGTVIAKNLYLEDKTATSTTAAGQLDALAADITEIKTENLTAITASIEGLQADIIAAKKIEVKDSSNNTIFKVDGEATNESERVKIGGFTVANNKLYNGSDEAYVELGTEAILLGGDNTIDAPFSVDNTGQLIAAKGKIGGFELTENGFYGSNDLTLSSAGEIIAKAGKIGGFEITNTGLIKTGALGLTSDAAYFESAQLNFGNTVKMYSEDNTVNLVACGTKNFEIRTETSNAGFKFEAQTGAQSATITLTLSNFKMNMIYAADPSKTDIYVGDFNFEFEANFALTDATGAAATLHEDEIVYVYLKYDYTKWDFWDGHTGVDGYIEKTVSLTIPKKEASGTLKVTLYTDVNSGSLSEDGYRYGQNSRQWKFSGNENAQYSAGTQSITKSLLSFSDSNALILKSLGSIFPNNSNNCVLGDTNRPWAGIVSKGCQEVTSDRNKKHQIQYLTTEFETFYDTLKPAAFKYNENTSDRVHTGFIAQDVEDSLNKAGIDTKDFAGICISEDPDSGSTNYTLRYGEFVSLNTLEVQKLKKRVTEQDARIAELERLVKEFKT